MPASAMLLQENTHSNSHLRILFLRSMMDSLLILSRDFTRKNIWNNSRQRDWITSIDLLMISLLKLSRAVEDLYGPVRTMMEMYSLILLLKVSDLSV